MFKKHELLKITKQIFRHSRGLTGKEGFNPNRDYLVGLSIALLIIFVSAVYATQLFLNLSREKSPSVNSLYNHQVINRAVDLYTTRSNAFNDLTGQVHSSQ